ncbi:MAG: glycosyltransferase family 9 protein [Candidatus Gastranaerophilales bacterium]|nr:glycosyltransferase family 9 protein [Candidatus Gastranaerophilales bacterium]
MKILIIRLSALGDTIHTIPLAVALKKKYPDCEIGWVVDDKAKHFILNNPVVDKCFVLPRKKWKKRGLKWRSVREFLAVVRRINSENYDIVIDAQQLFKSSSIMPFLNIKRKLTNTDGREFSWIFANEFLKNDRRQFDKNYHVVKRNLEFAKYLGASEEEVAFVLPEISEKTKEKIDGLLSVLDKNKKNVVLAPATTWKNKHWKRENWLQLANELSGSVNIILTGSSQDTELSSFIEKNINFKVLNLTGLTTLEELTEVIKRADAVVSPDSGSAHIAWATQKPSVVSIFCATSPDRTAPFGEKYISLGATVDCAPCMKKRCKQNNGILCTASVTVLEVVSALKKLYII